MLKDYLEINPGVQKALDAGKPVVALESTIISHGMPYPQNVETARNVEKIVREHGAEPATIAIIGGKIKIGLTDDELEHLGTAKNVIKTSRRDIPFIIAKKADGAATVATTMILAALAGIRVFVTGGIGGVHRGAQETFDISADLEELARTNVAVVCAGAKSILDLKLTLEYLETRGVPVVGFGTDELPAFYTRKSGFQVDYRVDSEKELAQAVKVKWEMGINGGLVIANPIPEQYQMDKAVIDKAIDEALADAAREGVKGKETTPYLLAKIKEITGGDSLVSNIQLVYNNAVVGTNLAVELAKLQ
ncbi:MAG: pseudouridine-5'-phosphate glycosidase [Ruminococcaceae bacterium]|nr:pseudouridine-5'-phosphate glycosidase [Oscillospiraceae bacterium]